MISQFIDMDLVDTQADDNFHVKINGKISKIKGGYQNCKLYRLESKKIK